MSNKSSLISIDILRAIAALSVFFYHQHIGSLLAKYSGIPLMGLTDNFGAQYGVPLFFLISGYCIHLSNIKYLKTCQSIPLKQYYKRRFLRIYPPYLVALLFTMIVNYFTYSKVPPLTDIVVHLFSLQGFSVHYFNTINLVLWAISVELAFYLIYPLFYYIRLKYSLNKALLFVLLVSSISIILFSLKSKISLPGRFCVFNLWFSWCCGAYLADKYTLDKKSLFKPAFAFIYLSIIAAFIFTRVIPNQLSIVYDQLNILIWTAPLIYLITKEDLLVKHSTLLTRMLANIGLSSYSLYLLHEPFITLKNFLSHRYLPAQFQLAGVSIGIFAIPVIAWYSFKYVEKPFTTRKKVSGFK